jgi:phosphoribosylformimino-5-aminoimidazole carboxamide ribotide isomerase
MRVIPVIDLLGGHVVHGLGGNRSAYQPIVSRLVSSPDPFSVARALVDHFSFREFYIADLDAIAGGNCAWDAFNAIAATGAKLLVDAGVRSSRRAAELLAYDREHRTLSGIVVGLESVAAPRQLSEIGRELDDDHKLFSLDLRNEILCTQSAAWASWSPIQVIEHAVEANFKRLIVLDLADVGKQRGTTTLSLCRQIRHAFPHVELIAGGGVRGIGDLERLASAGCNAALVASALHAGALTPVELNDLSVTGCPDMVNEDGWLRGPSPHRW